MTRRYLSEPPHEAESCGNATENTEPRRNIADIGRLLPKEAGHPSGKLILVEFVMNASIQGCLS